MDSNDTKKRNITIGDIFLSLLLGVAGIPFVLGPIILGIVRISQGQRNRGSLIILIALAAYLFGKVVILPMIDQPWRIN